jgi:hypothetical protein
MTTPEKSVKEKSQSEEWGAWKFVSDMLDNPDEYGIYPTSKCYEQIHDFVVEQKEKALKAERQKREEAVEAERERVVKMLNKRMGEYAQGRKKCGVSPEEEARAGRIEQREYALYEAIEALTQPNKNHD